MKLLKDERGNSLVYLLWIFTTTIVLFLIITNIARIYIVKQQASAAAELAALAATGEILVATEEAIKEFDDLRNPLPVGQKSLWEEIEMDVNVLVENGKSKQGAYIEVYNNKLPGYLYDSIVEEVNPPIPNLKSIIKSKFDSYLTTKIDSTVRQIIRENEGNEEHLEIKISKIKFRVEVKTDATYDSITDGSLLASFSKDIPQIGYGPSLKYLEKILP